MFRTVIVPLDGSAHDEIAVQYAIDEARRHGATLVLAHVIPRPEPCIDTVRCAGPAPRRPAWPADELAADAAAACRYLEGVVVRFGLRPDTTLRVVVGEPGRRLVAEAKRHPRPLVVMTTGDATDGAKPPLRIAARQLMLDGTVPVLTVRQPPPGAAPAAAASPHETIATGSDGPRYAPSRYGPRRPDPRRRLDGLVAAAVRIARRGRGPQSTKNSPTAPLARYPHRNRVAIGD